MKELKQLFTGKLLTEIGYAVIFVVGFILGLLINI